MQVRLMQRVAEVTGATGDAVDIVREAHQQELGKAAEAYKNAGAELGRVSGRTARQQLEALKVTTSSLQTADVAEEPLPSAAPARRAARPASPPATTGDGAESPEALMAAMQDESNADPVDLYYFGNVTPQQVSMVDLFKASETTKAALIAALREQFADEIATADGSMLGSMASVNLSLSAVEGDEGTLIRSVAGIEIPIKIVSIDGRWYVDATSSIAEAADQATALGQDPVEIMKSVNTFMRELVGRIQAGDFDTLQDVDMAFIQGLQTNFGAGG
jgi:hypothetical protein